MVFLICAVLFADKNQYMVARPTCQSLTVVPIAICKHLKEATCTCMYIFNDRSQGYKTNCNSHKLVFTD